jgi:hypothetical protein
LSSSGEAGDHHRDLLIIIFKEKMIGAHGQFFGFDSFFIFS